MALERGGGYAMGIGICTPDSEHAAAGPGVRTLLSPRLLMMVPTLASKCFSAGHIHRIFPDFATGAKSGPAGLPTEVRKFASPLTSHLRTRTIHLLGSETGCSRYFSRMALDSDDDPPTVSLFDRVSPARCHCFPLPAEQSSAGAGCVGICIGCPDIAG